MPCADVDMHSTKGGSTIPCHMLIHTYQNEEAMDKEASNLRGGRGDSAIHATYLVCMERVVQSRPYIEQSRPYMCVA